MKDFWAAPWKITWNAVFMPVRSFILEPLLITLINTDDNFSLVVVNYKCAESLRLFSTWTAPLGQYLHSEETGASCHAFFSISLGWFSIFKPCRRKFWQQKSSERKHRYFLLTRCDFVFTRATAISKIILYLKLTIENKIHDNCSFNEYEDVWIQHSHC